MKTYLKKIRYLLEWLFIITAPIWLIVSAAEESALIFYIGFAFLSLLVIIFVIFDIKS